MINVTRQFAEEVATATQARMAAALADGSFSTGARMQVALKATRYGSGSVSVTLEFTEAGVDRAEVDFKRAAHLVGLEPGDYGRIFQLKGQDYAVVGLNLGRPKFPIDIKRVADGKLFKFTESGARAKLGRAP